MVPVKKPIEDLKSCVFVLAPLGAFLPPIAKSLLPLVVFCVLFLFLVSESYADHLCLVYICSNGKFFCERISHYDPIEDLRRFCTGSTTENSTYGSSQKQLFRSRKNLSWLCFSVARSWSVWLISLHCGLLQAPLLSTKGKYSPRVNMKQKITMVYKLTAVISTIASTASLLSWFATLSSLNGCVPLALWPH